MKINKVRIMILVLVALVRVGAFAGKNKFIFKNEITKKTAEPVELNFEAEDFDGMKVFPDWHREKGQGWYIKEHKHASGRAFAVCDAESSGMSITKKFGNTFNAGKYLVGVRAVCTRWTDGMETHYSTPSGNVVRVEFGTIKNGEFDSSGFIELPMLFGSGYGFLPAPKKITENYKRNKYGIITKSILYEVQDPVVEIRKDWNAIKMTAKKVVSGGIGDTPEFSLPYILIDKLIITNFPGYKWIYDRRGRIKLLTAREFREQRRIQNREKVLKRKAARSELKSESVTGSKITGNYLRDGSFEGGGYPYWSPVMVGEMEFTFDVQDIVEGMGKHGKKFARLTPAQAGPHADQQKESPLLNANIRSDFFILPPGEFTVSYFAKASKSGAELGCTVINDINPVSVEKKEKLSIDWKQYSFEYKNKTAGKKAVYFTFETRDPELFIDLDAVQVTPQGVDFSKYQEREGVGMLIACDRPWNVFYDNEELKFTAILINGTHGNESRTAEYSIRDVTGKTFVKDRISIGGGPGVTKKEFMINFDGYGPYALVYKIQGEDSNPVFINFDRVQNPEKVEEHTKRPYPFIGGMTRAVRGRNAAILRRYGYQFKTDLSDPCMRANSNTYGYRQHYTYENDYRRMRKAGLKWAQWFWCGQPMPYTDFQYASGPAPHGGRPWMADKDAAWYARFILKTYEGLHDNLIMPTDEYLNQRVPRDGANLVSKVYKAVKDLDPRVEVMNSVGWPVSECLHKMLKGTKGKWSDWLGGSRYGCDKWWYMREARTLKEIGIDKFWVDGVSLDYGYPRSFCLYYSPKGTPLFTSQGFYMMNYYPWDLALLTACYRPERFCTYTCKYGRAASDPRNQFSLYDGRLTPVASQYVVTLQFLRDAEKGKVLFPKNASNIEACTFKNGNMNWVALYAPAPALLKEITLDMPADDYEIVDYHLLRSKAKPVGNDKSKFKMRRLECVFLGSENPEIVKAVENMQTKDLVEARHILSLGWRGKYVECRASVKNNSKETIKGKITLYKNMFYRKRPVDYKFELAPGKEKVFIQRQDEDVFKYPVSYFPVYSNLNIDGFFIAAQDEVPEEILQNKEGEIMRPGEFFFTHFAVPMGSDFKGKLNTELIDKWQEKQRPASVLINWGGGGSVKRAQVRRGAENTDCNMQPDGAIEYDFFSMHFVRYDRNALYIGARIEDDPSFAKNADWGEETVYLLQPELLKEVGERNPQNVTKIKVVQAAPDKLNATLIKPDGKKIKLQGVCNYNGKNVRKYLIRIPFNKLGFEIKPNQTMGFNIICRDSDSPDGKTECELDWAGATYAVGDAFGFGQLMVKPSKQ